MKIQDLKPNDVIHIRTKKEAKGIAELFDNKDDKECIIIAYDRFKENTTICFDLAFSFGKIVSYCHLSYSKREKNKIIPASKFLKPSLKQRISTLEKEIAELKSKGVEVKEAETVEPKLEVGKWVKYKDSKYLAVYNGLGNRLTYGFNHNGEWTDKNLLSFNPGNHKCFELATKEEVEQALIAEAKRRGLVEGATVKNKYGTFILGVETDDLEPFTVEFESFGGIIGLYTNCNNGGVWLMKDGIWAEVVKEEIQEIGWNKSGQIFIGTEGSIVINSGVHKNNFFSGICVEGKYKGKNSDAWSKESFKLHKEQITLGND